MNRLDAFPGFAKKIIRNMVFWIDLKAALIGLRGFVELAKLHMGMTHCIQNLDAGTVEIQNLL